MARFRLVGYAVLNTLIALLGPAALSSSLPQFSPPHRSGDYLEGVDYQHHLRRIPWGARGARGALPHCENCEVGVGYSSRDLRLEGFGLHAYLEHRVCDSLFRL